MLGVPGFSFPRPEARGGQLRSGANSAHLPHTLFKLLLLWEEHLTGDLTNLLTKI